MSTAAIPLMRLRARDTVADGSPLTIDWVRLSGGSGSGNRVSRVMDAQQMVTWDRLTYQADVPAGSTLRVSVRIGSTVEAGCHLVGLDAGGVRRSGGRQLALPAVPRARCPPRAAPAARCCGTSESPTTGRR